MNYKISLTSTLVATVLLTLAPAHAEDGKPPAAEAPAAEAKKLVGMLSSDAEVYDKAMACRRLAIIADDSAAPALGKLLSDRKLASYARTALEAIPGDAAGAALRDAAGRLEGDLLAGVIDSLGQRRDAKAQDLLKKHLASSHARVSTAAGRALARIGGPEAAAALLAAFNSAAEDRKAALASLCLQCAQRLERGDNKADAHKLYQAVRDAKLPAHLTLAARQRLIVAQGEKGLAELAELLKSDDAQAFRFGLQVARGIGAPASRTLIELHSGAPDTRQAAILATLADIGDASSAGTFLSAAQTGPSDARVQAIAALAKHQNADAVPVLIKIASGGEPTVSEAAVSTLSAYDGEKVDAAIAAALEGDDAKSLRVAATLAGRRGVASAAPALFKLARHSDAELQAAAIEALGATVSVSELPKLIDLTLTSSGKQHELASRSLKTACGRLPKQECVLKLIAAMGDQPFEKRAELLEHIAAVGGPVALKVVVAAARGDNDTMQDAGTRLLGEWLTVDAAPELLDMAKSLESPRYRLRTLRGYIGTAKRLQLPPEQRVAMCKNALAVAQRDEERRLVFEALRRAHSTGALELALAHLDDPKLSAPAAQTVVTIAAKTAPKAPAETRAALEKVIAKTKNPRLAGKAKAILQTIPQ